MDFRRSEATSLTLVVVFIKIRPTWIVQSLFKISTLNTVVPVFYFTLHPYLLHLIHIRVLKLI